jgi:hypothetical protein
VLALLQMSRLLRGVLPAGTPAHDWSGHWLLLQSAELLPVVSARSALAGLLQGHMQHRYNKGQVNKRTTPCNTQITKDSMPARCASF